MPEVVAAVQQEYQQEAEALEVEAMVLLVMVQTAQQIPVAAVEAVDS
jgi:hypothetical protein